LVSVTSQYSSKTRCNRFFGFSAYDSLKPLAYCEKISCHWLKRVPTNEGAKEGHSPLKRRYSTAIGVSNVKMVVDRHRHASIITSTGDKLLRNVNIDDLE